MSTRKRRTVDLEDQLRRAILKSGLSPYRVATDAEVDRSVMTRFLNGDRGITLATASKICSVLGVELRRLPLKGR